jgi:hypothetical protein
MAKKTASKQASKPAKKKRQPKPAPPLQGPSPDAPPGKGPRKPPARLRAVELMIQRYVPPIEIVTRISEKYSCTTRTVYEDIKSVWARLAEDEKEERCTRKAQMRISMRRLYNDAMKTGDWKAAIAVLDRLCKLDGLYDAVKIDHGGKVEVSHLRSGDQRARLEQLLTMAKKLGSAEPEAN